MGAVAAYCGILVRSPRRMLSQFRFKVQVVTPRESRYLQRYAALTKGALLLLDLHDGKLGAPAFYRANHVSPEGPSKADKLAVRSFARPYV